MAEEEAIQNPEESGADQSQADSSLDDFLSSDSEGDKQGETPDLSPEDKEAKKERDFEAGMHKFKDEAKRLKVENEELRSKIPQTPTDQGTDQPDLTNDPGVKILRDLIREEMKGVVAPVLESTRAEQETKVWGEFQQKEHVNALLPQIQETYASIPKTGDLASDLETARLVTIGKYHKEIVRAAAEAGQEQGFKDRTFKGAQAGITGRPNLGGKKDDFATRYRSGQVTAKELSERADEVEKIDREDMERDLNK